MLIWSGVADRTLKIAMAMACSFPVALSSTTTALASSSTRCITTVPQGRRGAVAGASTARVCLLRFLNEILCEWNPFAAAVLRFLTLSKF